MIGEGKGIINTSDMVKAAVSKTSYKVNGEETTAKKIKRIIDSPNTSKADLAEMNIEITGDKAFESYVKTKQNDAVLETQIDERVEGSDRKKLVDLRNQEEKAEAAVNKKGIFKVLNAEANLENIQQQIQEIQDKYSGVDRRKKASRAIEATKQQARIDRQQILLKATKNFAEVGSEQLGFDPFQSFQNNADFVKAYVERVLSGEISNAVDEDGNTTMTSEQIEARANELANEANNADAVNVVRAADGSKAIMINEEAAMKYGALQAGSHEILHGVLKGTLKQMNKAERKDLEAFLNAKGIEPGTIAPQNYFARNTYTDIVSNIELADNPFWEKIPMRYEMKTYFESGNNLEATLERIAVEKNQTPYERIKTKRHFSGLIQWQ